LSSIIGGAAGVAAVVGAVGGEGMPEEMVRWLGVRKLLAAIALSLLASAAAAADEPCRIAVLGDSLTSSYGLDLAQGFPARLEQRLAEAGFDCTVLDAGVTGDTSAGGRARLDWLLADEPSHVIVELGGNDALRALPPEEMERNLDAIIARLQAEGIPVLLAGMLAPPNLGADYGREFAAVFPRLAERHDVPLYPFFLDGVAGDPDLNQPDGIHPSAAGIERIVEGILPTVEEWLQDDLGRAS
jgi:acyl-CoA thioesterase-1